MATRNTITVPKLMIAMFKAIFALDMELFIEWCELEVHTNSNS